MINVKQQSGAVLVVSLVLLTVLTLIGVASMSSSSLEMRIASNAQQRNIAFWASQARIDYILGGNFPVTSPVDFKIPIPDPLNPPIQTCDASSTPACPDGVDWITEATVSYGGCGKTTGSSLQSGKGFSVRFFDVRAEGRTSTNSSYSTQMQGLQIPVASC